MLESDLESRAMAYAVKRGWYEIKIMLASRKGFPDRFLVRNGRVILIEFKRPGENTATSRNQKSEHKKLTEHGAEVVVLDTMDDARELLY